MIRAFAISINDLVALSRDAAMSASYKPALLKALVRVLSAQPRERIALRDLGAEFVRLYWNQTVVYHLRQAATIAREPEVLRAIRDAADTYRTRELGTLPSQARDRLATELARILQINVLTAFHTSASASMTPLYTWAKGDDAIVLDSRAVAFLVANAATVEHIANHWWARYLERVNRLAPLIIEKVQRDGARRGSLARYLRILRETDDAACFYCDRPLAAQTAVHVDHVIPWSFLLTDELWDLVLACAPCNLAKSDVLPERTFVAKLVALNERRGRLALPAAAASPLVTPDVVGRLYDAAVAVEWPRGWTPGTVRA